VNSVLCLDSAEPSFSRNPMSTDGRSPLGPTYTMCRVAFAPQQAKKIPNWDSPSDSGYAVPGPSNQYSEPQSAAPAAAAHYSLPLIAERCPAV